MLTPETVLATLAKNVKPKFANLTYRTRGTGELARYHIILGARTENLYRRDIEALETMLLKVRGDQLIAARALMISRHESLLKGIGNNSQNTNIDTYEFLEGIPGVRFHRRDQEFHFTGLELHKTVLEPAVKPSKPLTPRKAIERELPMGRFRQFAFMEIQRLACNGDVLEVE